jgi:hypothetical protein
MIGDPAQFETIGNRLGFEIAENTSEKLRLVWRGARFPAFLCLGIAVLLLAVSVPILEALRLYWPCRSALVFSGDEFDLVCHCAFSRHTTAGYRV